jgi:hypothetical protein
VRLCSLPQFVGAILKVLDELNHRSEAISLSVRKKIIFDSGGK